MSEERPRGFGGFRVEVEPEQILSRNGSSSEAAKRTVLAVPRTRATI